jgi:hypothetical protein
MNYGENQHVPDGVSLDSSFSILDSLLIDGTILIGQTGINTIEDTLFIQPARLANLDLMGGTIVVNTAGDVVVSGNLAVTGDLSVGGVLGVNTLAPLESDLILRLASRSAEGSASASFGSLIRHAQFLIQSPDGYTVTSFASTGDISTTGNLSARSASVSATLEAGELLTQKLTLLTQKTATDAAFANSFGESVLPSNQSSITILSTSVTQKSLIFITPTSTTNQTLFVAGKTDGKFAVGVSAPTGQPITFNWWVIN